MRAELLGDFKITNNMKQTTQKLLEQFKKTESEYFDQDGNAYQMVSREQAERMRDLIGALEGEIPPDKRVEWDNLLKRIWAKKPGEYTVDDLVTGVATLNKYGLSYTIESINVIWITFYGEREASKVEEILDLLNSGECSFKKEH